MNLKRRMLSDRSCGGGDGFIVSSLNFFANA
jgi:hypothetical protein